MIAGGDADALGQFAFGLTSGGLPDSGIATRLALLDQMASVVIDRSDTELIWLIIERCGRHRSAVPELDRVLRRLLESLEPAEADRVVVIALTVPDLVPPLVSWLDARPGPSAQKPRRCSACSRRVRRCGVP